MAVSASFHRNVFLLNQLVPPSEDFKKVFREGMFDKPNVAGFVQISHYLLTIHDVERYRKLVEWPVLCKKTEAKYRNDVKDYLNTIAVENPDMGFPHIVATYLHHASGTKFMLVMWKLSQLALKRYLIRNGHEIMSTPKAGPAIDLIKTYLEQSKASVTSNTLSRHRNCVQMEKEVNSALEEEKKHLAKIKTELFDKKQSVTKCTTTAPVSAFIKQRLKDVEDSEVMQMWKDSLSQHIQYIQGKNAILKNLEKICENISGILMNLSSDAKVLDGKQLEKINCSLISDLPVPPDVQHCLYHLYNDNQLVYHNFIRLYTLILYQVYQCLRKNELVDLSQCQLQLEASVEDMKLMHEIFETILKNMSNSIKESQSVFCEKSMEYMSGENLVLPFVNNLLLMSTPPIKINTNCADETSDLQKVYQLTPGEIAHKSLFSRYVRHKRIYTPDLRSNLFVSRINIDNIMSLDSNDKHRMNLSFAMPKMNKMSKRPTRKYTRLFSLYTDKNKKANSSMTSLPFTAQANSSVIASTVGEMPNISDLNLNATARDYLNLNEESLTISCISPSAQFTPIKSNTLKDVSQEQARDKFDYEFKINKLDLDGFTEVQFVSDENKGTVVKQENSSRRRSISDLVERYKKLLEVSNSTMTKFQNEYEEQKVE